MDAEARTRREVFSMGGEEGAMAEPDRGEYLLFTDAGVESSGNERLGDPLGRAAIGVILKKRRNGRLHFVRGISKPIGGATKDAAEYQALIEGLELARSMGVYRIRVFMDRESVVDRMNGEAKVKQKDLEMHTKAMDLYEGFPNRRISWLPREINAEADALASLALVDERGRASTPRDVSR
jgi:ribonuclease HI